MGNRRHSFLIPLAGALSLSSSKSAIVSYIPIRVIILCMMSIMSSMPKTATTTTSRTNATSSDIVRTPKTLRWLSRCLDVIICIDRFLKSLDTHAAVWNYRNSTTPQTAATTSPGGFKAALDGSVAASSSSARREVAEAFESLPNFNLVRLLAYQVAVLLACNAPAGSSSAAPHRR